MSIMAAGDRYDSRDTDPMRPKLPSCYGTGAYEDCPGRCPHRDWCWLDQANGHYDASHPVRRVVT